MAGAGRHHPAFGPLLLDHEALVLGHGIEADLQAVDGPAVEVFQQIGAAAEQGAHLFGHGRALGRRIALARKRMIADLEAAALVRWHEIEADVAGLLDDRRRRGPGGALIGRWIEIDHDLTRGHEAAGEIGQQPSDPGTGGHHDGIGAVFGARRGDDAALFEIDAAHGRLGMQSHARVLREMAHQRGHDVLGEEFAAAFHPVGALDAARLEQREAPPQLVERQFDHRLAERRHAFGRAFGPVDAVAGERQRAGGGIELLAEVRPYQIPGGIGLVDHAGVAFMDAVGVTDQPMLVHRRGQRIG